MRQSITFEGETVFAYDGSEVEFTYGFRTLLEQVFGQDNVTVDDEGHGGGVSFFGSYIIDASEERVDFVTAALIALTDNHGFDQLIVHSGPCDIRHCVGEE